MDQTLDTCFHDLPLEMVLHIAVASKNARLLLDLMLSYRRLAEFVRAHKTGIMKLFTKTIHASVKVKIYSANTVSAWNLVNGDLYVKHEIGMYTKAIIDKLREASDRQAEAASGRQDDIYAEIHKYKHNILPNNFPLILDTPTVFLSVEYKIKDGEKTIDKGVLKKIYRKNGVIYQHKAYNSDGALTVDILF